MANYSGYSSKILVSNIPNNFSKLKLKLKLEEVVGDGCIEDYEQINDNLVKITVVNIRAQQNSLDSCISLTFGGQKHELKLKYLEEDNAGTGIYTFLVSEAYPKPILNYLSKSRKHTEEIKKMLEQHNLKLLHISPEKIEVQNAAEFIKSEEDCGECIQRFLKLYSSWNEKLENSSVADIKHIKTVLAKYKDECYYRWFNDSSTILVIGPKIIVEEIQNLINDHLVKSPKKMPPPANSTALSFNYEEIHTFLVSEAYPKPILNYLSKSPKHTEEFKKMLQQYNLKLLHISSEKIEVQNAGEFVKSEENCGECIQRFLELYSSWNEKLENCSVADIKHIKTVLAEYKDECYYRWFNDSSTILVIGPKTIVEEVQNLINDHLEKSPRKMPPPANSTALSCSYEEIYTFLVSEAYPKPILNYLSKSPKHTEEFKKMLQQYNLKLLHISYEKIQVQNAGEFIKSEEDCGECIQRFINLYSSWNEELENCSVADIKHIKTIFAKYKERCFNCWFNDSSTILVIGPKTIVEEVQNLIKSHLKNIQLPANSTAQPFNYEDVEGAIMRFVSFGKTYKDQLSLCLTGLANVEIVQKDETLSVHVSPTQMSSARLHMDFENECRMKLKQFFMQFTVWKGNVDLAVIARLKHHRPDLFETKNFQDHYVRWFMDTGVVNVVGISWHVQRCRSLMEKLLGASTIHSLADSQPFSTPAPIHGRPFPTPVPLLHVIPPQQVMNGATSKHNAERSRKLSSEDFSDESSSSSKAAPMNTVQFDTKDFKPDVLRFVVNDPFAKKNLGSCCGKLAKVSITYDQKRQIKVHITFRKKNPSDVDKSRALEQVGKYFDQFSAETNKYDANKIKTVMEKFPKLFCEEFGVFVQASLSKGTIKYAGVKENVKKRINEIEYEIKSERREERLSVDVFIAQRECGLWKKTEQKCLNKGHQVSITPFKEGKIAYKGDLNAIQLAKTTLGELYMKTIRKPVEDLTPDQLTFLKKCENSQKKSLGTKKNILDDLYRQFKKENVKGSLAFRDSEVSLVVGNNTHWQTANRLLKESIEEFDISPSDYKKDTPFPEVVANLKKAFRDEIVHLKSERDSRKVIVFCFNFQHKQMRMKVIKTIEQMGDMNDIEKFYPMSREKAEHFANHCKIDKAKSVELVTESTGTGLLVTLEEEDIDTVDMKLEDLEKEIKKIEKQFTGHSLYDYLSGEGIFIKKATELETKCSIFLDSVEQKSSSTLITVKLGDILQEKCDAIVNSTGKSLEFSGQVSTALKKRFGTDLLEAVLKNSKWVMENQLCICDTGGQLPWKYIFNISTPTGKSEFTSAILYLLKEAEKLGVQSLALPTIGAGNIGLDPTVVASYMKDAFARFDAQKSLLQDIRVVVFQSSQLSVFQDIIPKQGINKLETRMTVKMYGSSVASLDEAMEKFEESCDKIIKSFVIKTTRPEFYGFEKSEIEKFCRVNDVLLEWKSTKNVEECHIQGLSDNVKKVKDLIDKLLEEDYPTNWSSMSDGQNVKRVELSEISPEYLDVKRKFEESQPSYSRLIKIERVQNKLLYSQFKDRRNAKKVEFAGQNKVITRQLFHGTSFDTVDKICASGFDRNFSGKNGTVYGCGVYFAVKSQYSVGYSRDQTKYMFLSEVITGDYILGNYKYKAPPEKSQSTRYDSCVDNQSNPTIFVVFSDSSVYPSYIITFQ